MTEFPFKYANERVRLLACLDELTEGGTVEGIRHIGATSVPGLEGSGCIDIGIAVWPFPLPPERRAALQALGYAELPESEFAGMVRFEHAGGEIRLHVVEAGSEHWTDFLILREYLREHADARRRHSSQRRARDDVPEPQQPPIAALLEAGRAWWVGHQGFAPVESVARELADLPVPWCVSSGWALDLFLGRATRVHHDLDIVVGRGDQLALRQYMTDRGWQFVTYWEGHAESWPPAMELVLPRHQVHAHRDGEFIDFLFSEVEGDTWRYRRDPAVTRAGECARLFSDAGLPYLAPEVVLLFKSKRPKNGPRSKDEADFEQVLPYLDPERRAWLQWALTVSDREHPWIERLG